ncbi:DUF2339 domain-containing protein [Corynebacterium meitnerae]|uniref:DUF2339 domain-containing protein n=1 Tax=Corynebacterium meitnerae TaxID=2913498 RepID=A0A9X3LRM1_9CORY|nr:DUF2339 domain-containing protein [Corynebacterium meitnerae]MCZ9292929.1 DUF2339 domain-containing protein [Corynebacterium meitnerae]
MHHSRDEILTDVRRKLGELRASTARSQMLIDDIQATLNHLSPAPVADVPVPAPAPVLRPPAMAGAPMPPQPPHQVQQPQKPPKPPKPKLTTEQQVMRWAAVIGSIITFVGASFGIALAIQTGLLGPVGRVVGAALLAFVLLGVGIRVDQRKGTSAGVMALYVTSFLILILDLWYAYAAQEWLKPLSCVVIFLVLWLGYLALAHWRKNLPLVLAMCIILVFYTFPLLSLDYLANALILVAPIAVILLTWPMSKGSDSRFLAIVRSAAGVLLAWQTGALSSPAELRATYLEQPVEPISFVLAVPLIGLVLLVIGEIFFAPTSTTRAQSIVPAVVAPAAILLASYTLLHDAGVWLPFLTATAVTVLVTVLRPKDNAQRAADLITGWFITLPFTLFRPVVDTQDFELQHTQSEAVSVLIFFAVAIVVLLLLHRLPMNRVAVLSSWALMLFIAILPMLENTLFPSAITRWSWFGLIQGLALAVLIIIAATRTTLWRSLPIQARGAFAAYGLLLEMVSVVTISAVLGHINALFADPSSPYLETSRLGFYNGHMLVSISWMAAASWLLLKRPGTMDAKTMRTAGLFVAIVATVKLVLFDMAALGGIPRVLTFIVCGLILIAVAIKGAQQQKNTGQTFTETQPASN